MEKAEGQERRSAQDAKLVTVLWPKQVPEATFRVSVGEGPPRVWVQGGVPNRVIKCDHSSIGSKSILLVS